MKRKFSNDQLFPIFSYYKKNGMNVAATAKKFKLAYSDTYYRVREYDRRMRKGEDGIATDSNNNKIRVSGLAPFMIRFNDVDKGWDVLRKNFNNDQLTIITKFYNTVIYQADCISTDKVNVITETAGYEQ